MPRHRSSQPGAPMPSTAQSMVWLRADYEFPSTFSYRMPDVSAQFAIGSPVPSPTTVKLALVDTAIRWSGDVNEGRRIFELVKPLSVCIIPPPRVVRFRAFIKRLKPDEVVVCPDHPNYKVSSKIRKDKRHQCPQCGKIPDKKVQVLVESTGIRDYFLLDGPLSVYIEVPQAHAGEIARLLSRIRRFGTSDSVCWCAEISREDPPQKLCPKLFNQASPIQAGLVVRLSDLTQFSEFDGFTPFGGVQEKAHLDKKAYVLPLTIKRSGETWAILQREKEDWP